VRTRDFFAAILAGILYLLAAVPALAQQTASDFSNGGTWSVDANPVALNRTSTCSIRVASGLIRTYYTQIGGTYPRPINSVFSYNESADGSVFGAPQGVYFAQGSPGGINPAVAQLHDGSFLMVYEVDPNGLGNPSGAKVLYALTSTDGANFGVATQLPSTALDSNANGSGLLFQSVPNLVVAADGSVRVYYVAGGVSGIASMRSTDGGKTWVPDPGYRIAGQNLGPGGGAIGPSDPTVLQMPDGSYVMFLEMATYTSAGQSNAYVINATSSDGLTFTPLTKNLFNTSSSVQIDPDVYQSADGRWHTLFGQTTPNSSSPPNLYHAVFSGTAGGPVTPQTGYWWNPSEGGRGFTIETQGVNTYISGFMYAADGSPIWYLSAGVMVNSFTYYGTFVHYTGSATLNGFGPSQAVGSVGNLSLLFNSNSSATMVFPGGTRTLQRYEFVPGGLTSGPAAGLPETGLWWNANEPGRGYFMEFQGDTLFFAAYMYDRNKQGTWYMSQGTMSSPTLYQGQLQSLSGGQTLTGAYKPASVTGNAGAVTLQFTSTTTATMTYPDGAQVAITRFRF